MIIRVVKFESALSEDEVLAVAKERDEQFQRVPGLLQKYYIKLDQPNHYGGVYLWDSMESLRAYEDSELAATVASAYKTVAPPIIEVFETLFQLRDD